MGETYLKTDMAPVCPINGDIPIRSDVLIPHLTRTSLPTSIFIRIHTSIFNIYTYTFDIFDDIYYITLGTPRSIAIDHKLLSLFSFKIPENTDIRSLFCWLYQTSYFSTTQASVDSLLCLVCTTSWTQSRMHWMILNATWIDSFFTWMTGWIWFRNSQFRNEQPLMQTHQLHECLRAHNDLCLPGDWWCWCILCCKPEQKMLRLKGPTKQLTFFFSQPSRWTLSLQVGLPGSVSQGGRSWVAIWAGA